VRFFAALAPLAFLTVLSACGRKGPPLPPLVKLPVAPTELTAERHGSTVDLRFVVPGANTDGTRPANIERVDVYGITGPEAITDQQLFKLGTKISSVEVKAPRDPAHAVDSEEPEEVEMTSAGLDQGARAHVVEQLTPELYTPVKVEATAKKRTKPPAATTDTAPATDARPLAPAPPAVPSRLYVAVPVSTRGKNGPSSSRVRVAMIPEPPPLAEPEVSYDEKTVTVTWPPLPIPAAAAEPASGDQDVLPSRPIGMVVPRVTYNVYEVSDTTPATLTRLTSEPVKQPRFSDPRVVWGAKRCYVVRALVTIEQVSLEGNDSPPQCATFVDTFPPAAPAGIQAVPSDGAITLIWDANGEKDIKGYIVLRGAVGSDKLEKLTADPIADTSYQDKVPAGTRYAYAVEAVDTAGNVSPMSQRVEETAR